MALLEHIDEPAGLRGLSHAQLGTLAEEIRAFLVRHVARNGGHLGPNLGVVELTLALHRCFDSPRDTLLWDVGHQAYVHKILTGRTAGFARLRRRGGLSGYPSRSESAHDHIEHSHASMALSYADGMAKARQLAGDTDRHIVAVVGDGALTGGAAWEALNNIAAAPDRPLVIVLNDNGRSYAPTVGGLARHLSGLRTHARYGRLVNLGRQALTSAGAPGRTLHRAVRATKQGIKDALVPQPFFAELGLAYLGPVDGHDIPALEEALERAKEMRVPVVVHCITRKGLGYRPAEQDETDHFHGVGAIDPDTGVPLRTGGLSWSEAFGRELATVAGTSPEVVAITAAMPGSVGLTDFAAKHPSRFFDVGIAEQHAVASAAGLAMSGLHPVVALYGTFLNRAVDQVLMDLALHRLGVTLVIDRAGVTGDDGPSHNGLWDLALLRAVPGLRMAAPRDLPTLREELGEALEVADAPTALRFPRGAVGTDIPALRRSGGVDVLHEADGGVLLVAVGVMARTALEAARLCAGQGVPVTVVDPRWVQPLPPELLRLAARHSAVVTVEDGLRTGGVGTAVTQQLADAGIGRRVRVLGVSEGFPEQGTRDELLAEAGLDARAVAEAVISVAGATAAGVTAAGPAGAGVSGGGTAGADVGGGSTGAAVTGVGAGVTG
ncbi:1-deoxy-D-xylulose-5-phosphate synthase [Actinacidiphila acidipaludis]|uniref:1-deoxy-D-xylulose-5-phosphate synthase n=1 Tax=Actinacidiphila acidipaludis TaxID=2873382 RepID=A0ABS7Q9Z7_9ACTN|nr:1-deoxy-D-xylulose-5-phosphate synthase [Streptomyces acidipaludis]MBY8879661.1 1-deoxy-D-xylulose-5-phosphate synthase [Streptomyces acidipaludis]